MAHAPKASDQIQDKAKQPALVEHFVIANLHGYRTVSMETPDSATILIAQNGAGKTTLIGALNAVLRGQYARLQKIDFEYIEIKIAGTGAQKIWKKDVDEFIARSLTTEFVNEAALLDIRPSELFSYLTQDFNREEAERNYYTSTTPFDKFVSRVGYNLRRGADDAEKLALSLYQNSENLYSARREIVASLRGVEVLYLPTYRRIELALAEDETAPRRRRRPDIKFSADSLFSGTMQFGLSDISDQLENLNRDIVNESNNGYRKISANIINDLIKGRFPNDLPPQGALPSEEDLRLFFSRLAQGPHHGGYYPISIPNLDQIYAPKEDSASNQFLSYFLGYLNDVISAVRRIEDVVNQFVATCNAYLGSTDPSTEMSMVRRYRSPPLDPKEIVLDRSDLSVSVRSVASDVVIPLDSLSSGEKQMISLFAKMFLYPKEKIVLIDEPELSLSLDWQAHILPDILMSPSCRQLIAITHSPFVFENALEPFARAIDLEILPRGASDLFENQ